MPISDGLISARQLCSNSVDTRNIAPGAVTPTEVLTGFNFVELVTVLPTTGNFEGRMVYLTTDDKLYRHDGAAFLLAVDGADITAATISGDRMIANTITAGQIAVGTITASEIAANTITATELNVTTLSAITASMGTLTVDSTITMGTGGIIRTNTSGQRIELSEAEPDQVNLYSGDAFENLPGFLRSAISGAGATRTLQVNLRAASTTGDTNSVQVIVRTESFDDSTSRPGVVFAYAGGSSQDPLFALQNDFDLRIGGTGLLEIDGLGSASNPAIGIGTSFDDGIYSPADSELAIVTAGVLRARFTNTQLRVQNGSAGAPSVAIDSDTDLGLYRFGSNDLAIAANATAVARFRQTGENQGATSREDGALFIDTAYVELDSGAGSIIGGQSWQWDVQDNTTSLELQAIRDSTGTTHTTAAVGFRRITDSTTQSTLFFASSGIGIGTSGPTRVLTVAGTFSAAPRTHTTGGQAAAWFNISGSDYEISRNTSSKRYKKFVKALVFDPARYAQLRPVTFDPKSKVELEYRGGRKAIGQIAEEVEGLYPELAIYDEQGLPDGIDQSLVHLNTAAILDLMRRVDALETAA